MIWSSKILVSLLSCGALVLPHSIDIYDKESMSKIELTKNLIATLPKPENKGYVLAEVGIVVKIFLMVLKKLAIVILVL